VPGARDDPIVHQPEETGEAKIGGHNHHAEQQRDGVKIGRAIGLVEREHTRSNHEACAQQRCAGAVEVNPGSLPTAMTR
jgi:hypothetical protein